MRRRLALGTTLGLVAVAAGAVVVSGSGSGADGSGVAADDPSVSAATAQVARRDLTETEDLDGTLGYGERSDLSLGAGGTVTALAAEGSVVDRGGVLGEVDGRPVVLLFGERPLWRALGPGADTSDGPDIRQLEENLIALGFGTAAQLGPNDVWSDATTRAVQRWQESLGLEETGRVEPGSVVFRPGPVRVAEQLATPGSPAGAPALAVTGTEAVVIVDVPATRRDLLAVDQAVEVELPGGTSVAGTVRSVSSVVEQPDPQAGGDPTIEVVIALADAAAAGGLDQAPVEVHVRKVIAEDALTVPVEALLALAEGGYAVEQADGTLVGVELGEFADGFVEVTPTRGELAEGDEVVVPQ